MKGVLEPLVVRPVCQDSTLHLGQAVAVSVLLGGISHLVGHQVALRVLLVTIVVALVCLPILPALWDNMLHLLAL